MKVKINGLNVNYIKEVCALEDSNQNNNSSSAEISNEPSTKHSPENVVILEGWGTKISTYNVLINSLKTYSNVYCYDMPGFGDTDEPKSSLNLDDYVDLAIKFIESQNLKAVSLIGHSNGARVIFKMMSKKDLPFKVNKIIIIGGAGLVHKKTFSQNLKIKYFKAGKKFLSLHIIKALFPNALDNFKNKFGSADYKSATPVMRETMVKLINEDIREYLPGIKAPTILIYGENDTATPPADGEYIREKIPDAGFIKVKYASHYVFLEYPAYVNLIIKTFIESSSSGK